MPGEFCGDVGATFGDNVSPVSDTTIASATTQGAEIGAVVRSRMRYALPAAAMAMVAIALTAAGEATSPGDEAAGDGLRGLLAGMPRLAAWSIGLANYHSWALGVMLVLAITTGYGRRK